MQNLPPNKKIIVFDDVCNLCNYWVQFTIKKDSKDVFRFVALQSEIGKKIVEEIGFENQKMDSIILYKQNGAYFYQSKAVFEIIKDLKGSIKFFLVFSLLPNFVTNCGYNFIAKNRYRWFGKLNSCMLPTPKIAAKFL